MRLHSEQVVAPGATPTRWVVLLHGILGRGENLRGVATRLCARLPDWGAVLVDLRMHGASQGFAPPHTLCSAADDVLALLGELPEVRAVVGHSFGGKVALALLGRAPHVLERVIVLDASPSVRTARAAGDLTARVLDALGALPGRLADRTQFSSALQAHGVSLPLVQWLAKNLVREADGLRFALDVGAIRALLDDHDRFDGWPRVEAPPAGTSLAFVVAGRSHVVDATDRTRLAALAERGPIALDVLPDAGHWLHVDDPEAVLELLAKRLG